MTRHLCDSALGTVHYVDEGPRDGAPVVLLHQVPRSLDEYAEVLPLVAAERRVLAVDLPGYGCSSRPPLQPSIADYAASVVSVLDAAGVERAHVCGHHTGAVVALEMAAAFPSRVASAALSGPVYLDAPGREEIARHFGQWRVKGDGSHLGEKWAKFSSWIASPALVQRLVVDLFRAGETSELGHFAVAAYRMEERLPLVSCPGLLIYGARDPFASREHLPRFLEAFRPGSSVTIDGGIFLPNEAPGDFARALIEFTGALRDEGAASGTPG